MTMRIEFVSLTSDTKSKMREATVLCLGNFDGVHMAHRELMKEAKALRDSEFPMASCGVFCFQGFSTDFLQASPVAHLCTREQRLALFREAGMEFAILADFPSIKDLSADAFIEDLLIKECGCVGTVCGYNYKFGRGGIGSPSMLIDRFRTCARVVPPITVDDLPVSSTHIRALLALGEVEEAHRLLCRPYSFQAPVVHGKHLGRTIGIPTINQTIPKGLLIPAHGVYVTECTVDGKSYCGVTNVGVHPTVDSDAALNAETYLLDFSEEIYDKSVTTAFLHRLRPEMKFESLDSLREQIAKDVSCARALRSESKQ